ncbi:cytokinesis protein 3 [Scheffersomyces spartinae]|uniref:Cytokinesis protein 3 n=1 Tax=Scheffersomyces spartinae TaxID=45513 RepID=A0A9P8AHX8_9ASCO|nr:cytokinesis protein 3 [Scheffersomyces spartinae]KAG7193155.1 cytokinesis protein 3 [Scheffersomyces spartinae]
MASTTFPLRVKTLVSWPGEQEGDLGFIENEIVEVFAAVDDSWWNGRLRRNGAEGIFPKDYVEVLDDKLLKSTSHVSLVALRATTPDGLRRNSKSGTPIINKYTPSAKEMADYDYSNQSILSINQELKSGGGSTAATISNPVLMKKKLSSSQKVMMYEDMQQQLGRERELELKLQLQEQQIHMLLQNALHLSSKPALTPIEQQHQHQQHKQLSMRGKLLHHDETPDESPSLKSHQYNSSLGFGGSPLHNNISNSPNKAALKAYPASAVQTPPAKSSYHTLTSEYDSMTLEELSLKRKQLEMELEKLKLVEMTQKRRSQYLVKEDSSTESYMSEDLVSSKKNQSSAEDLLSQKTQLEAKQEKYDDEADADDEEEDLSSSSSPPPPPPPKHLSPSHNNNRISMIGLSSEVKKVRIPYDADDFAFSGSRNKVEDEKSLSSSKAQQEHLRTSVKSLQSDVLNLSELSATSAGSYLRHKSGAESLLRQMAPLTLLLHNATKTSDEELMELAQDRKTSKQPNIFRKLLSKKKEDPSVSDAQASEGLEWNELKADLNRMSSLTTQDRQNRTKRVVRNDGGMIVKPLEFISEINTNEIVGNSQAVFSMNNISYNKVSSFVKTYSVDTDLNDLISDVSIKFRTSKLNQIFAVLLHLCKYTIIEEPNKILQQKPKLKEIAESGEATIYQLNYLFKKILDALRIDSKLVLGFWKKPNEYYHDEQYVINHCWLSLLVEDQYRFIDLLLFRKGSICHISGFNEFYFLAEPLQLVSTHIPSVVELQHVVPPIDQNVAFYLPRVYSGYFKNELKFINFNNALTKLKDMEIFELEMEISPEIEIFTLIKTASLTTNDYSLSQVHWPKGDKRVAKIKALLPEGDSIGVLQIFAGPKGKQKHLENVHELAVVIPLQHDGELKPCKFVPRFPTAQSQDNDLYIKQPQVSKLIAKNSYNFKILQHPSKGMDEATQPNPDFKLVIQSPSGKYFKLTKDDPSLAFGTYSTNIKNLEPVAIAASHQQLYT